MLSVCPVCLGSAHLATHTFGKRAFGHKNGLLEIGFLGIGLLATNSGHLENGRLATAHLATFLFLTIMRE